MSSSPLFRQESLDRLQTADEYDQLLVVVNRKAWILLASLGLLCGGALAWSILGTIPVTVDGFGVLINPGNVRGIQSPGGGQITSVMVREGLLVQQGDVIAVLNQPALRQQLEQERENRIELLSDHELEANLDSERRRLETAAAAEQRQFINEEIAKLDDLARRLRDQSVVFNDQQRENLAATRELTMRLNGALASRLQTIKTLRLEGLSSQESVLNSESAVTDSQARIAGLDAQLQELDLRSLESEQAYLQQQNRLSELRLRMVQLDVSEKQLNQELVQKAQRRESELRELDNRIERIELRLGEESQVVSEWTGRILEIASAAGQVIGPGTRIGTIEVEDPEAELKNLAYFNVRDGKRIESGDSVRVTPATVKRERFGSIVGTVSTVSDFPITQEAVVNVVGNAQIAQALLQQGGAIEVEVDLDRDSDSYSGYRWTSKGPPLQLSAGTTTTVRITIEQRAPISYVLPILRTWVFGERDDREPRL